MSLVTRPPRILDPGLCLTLRPMAYPGFFEMYRAAIRNTWTVEEVDFATDVADLRKMSAPERHLVQRLVAFFATGDSIVANNLVLNLFLGAPSVGKLSSMYLYAWKSGLKTTYYLRSRPATRIAQATVAAVNAVALPALDDAAIACSLENPESCEACQ